MSKRIQSACLMEDIRFDSNQEYQSYRSTLNRKKVRYSVESEQANADGSVFVRVKRQYNRYAVNEYFD